MKRRQIALAAIALTTFCSAVALGTVRRVDPECPTPGDGSSWSSAILDLQAAIDASSAGDHVWVKAGTYKPSLTDRGVTFNLKSLVKMYGGFSGSPTETPEDRNLDSNATVLSGEICTLPSCDPITHEDNIYHVVTAIDLAAGTLLDGFFIEEGYARNAPSDPNGAGLYVRGSYLEVYNCRFTKNEAERGGAVYISESSTATSEVYFDNCRFTGNVAGLYGGGIYADGDTVALVNRCEFRTNVANVETNAQGGGLYISGSSTAFEVRDSLFADNVSKSVGAGLRADDGADISIFGCTVAGNRTLTALEGAGLAAGAASVEVVRSSVFWGNHETGASPTITYKDQIAGDNESVEDSHVYGIEMPNDHNKTL